MNISLFIRSVFRSYLKSSDTKQKVQETTVTVENESSLHTEIDVNNTDKTLQDVDGVGPKYEEKLKENGITSVLELANKSPSELSEQLSVSEDYANRWISSAKEFVH